MSFPYTLATFTIANGAATSNQIFIADGELVGILMDPTGWTTAPLTFLVSVDGTNFYEMYDGSSTLVEVPTPAAATYIAIGEAEAHIGFAHFRGVQYLQLQSGTTASQVNQGAARTLVGVIRKTTTGTF